MSASSNSLHRPPSQSKRGWRRPFTRLSVNSPVRHKLKNRTAATQKPTKDNDLFDISYHSKSGDSISESSTFFNDLKEISNRKRPFNGQQGKENDIRVGSTIAETTTSKRQKIRATRNSLGNSQSTDEVEPEKMYPSSHKLFRKSRKKETNLFDISYNSKSGDSFSEGSIFFKDFKETNSRKRPFTRQREKENDISITSNMTQTSTSTTQTFDEGEADNSGRKLLRKSRKTPKSFSPNLSYAASQGTPVSLAESSIALNIFDRKSQKAQETFSMTYEESVEASQENTTDAVESSRDESKQTTSELEEESESDEINEPHEEEITGVEGEDVEFRRVADVDHEKECDDSITRDIKRAKQLHLIDLDTEKILPEISTNSIHLNGTPNIRATRMSLRSNQSLENIEPGSISTPSQDFRKSRKYYKTISPNLSHIAPQGTPIGTKNTPIIETSASTIQTAKKPKIQVSRSSLRNSSSTEDIEPENLTAPSHKLFLKPPKNSKSISPSLSYAASQGTPVGVEESSFSRNIFGRKYQKGKESFSMTYEESVEASQENTTDAVESSRDESKQTTSELEEESESDEINEPHEEEITGVEGEDVEFRRVADVDHEKKCDDSITRDIKRAKQLHLIDLDTEKILPEISTNSIHLNGTPNIRATRMSLRSNQSLENIEPGSISTPSQDFRKSRKYYKTISPNLSHIASQGTPIGTKNTPIIEKSASTIQTAKMPKIQVTRSSSRNSSSTEDIEPENLTAPSHKLFLKPPKNFKSISPSLSYAASQGTPVGVEESSFSRNIFGRKYQKGKESFSMTYEESVAASQENSADAMESSRDKSHHSTRELEEETRKEPENLTASTIQTTKMPKVHVTRSSSRNSQSTEDIEPENITAPSHKLFLKPKHAKNISPNLSYAASQGTPGALEESSFARNIFSRKSQKAQETFSMTYEESVEASQENTTDPVESSRDESKQSTSELVEESESDEINEPHEEEITGIEGEVVEFRRVSTTNPTESSKDESKKSTSELEEESESDEINEPHEEEITGIEGEVVEFRRVCTTNPVESSKDESKQSTSESDEEEEVSVGAKKTPSAETSANTPSISFAASQETPVGAKESKAVRNIFDRKFRNMQETLSITYEESVEASQENTTDPVESSKDESKQSTSESENDDDDSESDSEDSLEEEQSIQNSCNVSETSFMNSKNNITVITDQAKMTNKPNWDEVRRRIDEKIANIIKKAKQKAEENSRFQCPASPRKPRSSIAKRRTYVLGEKYPKPKLYKPAHWANKRLYDYLSNCLRYEGLNRMLEAEKVVRVLHETVETVLRSKIYQKNAVQRLKIELASRKIIVNTFDFYEFVRNYLPRQFEDKVIPCVQPYSNLVWPPKDNSRESDPILF